MDDFSVEVAPLVLIGEGVAQSDLQFLQIKQIVFSDQDQAQRWMEKVAQLQELRKWQRCKPSPALSDH